MDYKDFSINAAECIEIVETKNGSESCTFLFITDLPVTVKKCVALVAAGRRRWRIENEGFDTQKNHGYNLKHIFSRDYTAMQNHYFLIQIAHAISQLMALLCANLKHLLAISKARLHALIFEAFKNTLFSDDDLAYIHARFQVRFL